MNILQINLSKRWGGGEKSILELSKTLKKMGHNVYLVGIAGSTFMKKAQEVGFEVLPIVSFSQFDIVSIGILVKYLKKFSIQIINAHTARSYFIASIAGKIFSIPVVFTRHVCFPVKPHLLNKLLYFQLADKIIGISNAVRDSIINSLAIDSNKIEVIYDGVRIDEFYNESKYYSWLNNLSSKKEFVIATISRLDENKGIDTFIHAANIVSKSMPNAKFLIVGQEEKKFSRKLKKLINSAVTNQNIIFRGFINDVSSLLYDIDIFVRTSTQEALGFGVIEAMATGRPVIATNVGGLPEVIDDGITGILIPSNNPELLSEKIIFLLNHPEILQKFSINAIKSVREKFDINDIAKKTILVYEELYNECKKKHLQ